MPQKHAANIASQHRNHFGSLHVTNFFKFKLLSSLSILIALPAAAISGQSTAPSIAQSSAAVPVPAYALPKKPSEVLTDRAALDALARQVLADASPALMRADLPTAQRDMFEAAAIQANLLLGQYGDAIALSQSIAARSKDPASVPLAGLLAKGLIAADQTPGDLAARQKAMTESVMATLRQIPVQLVASRLKAQRATFAAFNAALVVKGFAAQLDPIYARRKALELPIAAELMGTGFAMRQLPDYATTLVQVIDGYLASDTVPPRSIWPERSFDLDSGTFRPVAVAIWDNGFDPADHPGRVLAAAAPDGATAGATCGTLAFDQRLSPASGDLLPLPSAWRGREAELVLLVQGSVDASRGAETTAAAAYRSRLAQLNPGQLRDFLEAMGFARRYVHGRHVAAIAAQGNSAIRMMNIRMQTTFSLNEDRLGAFPEAVRRSIAQMRSCGVRVANLSWGLSRLSLEAAFISKGMEPDPARRRQRIERLYAIVADALRESIASAPDILFVVAAGNDSADRDNEEAVPASIALPNVLTVGAVDLAGKPTGFSGNGTKVSLYANGVDVVVSKNGDATTTFSGTSAAAPYVTNAAAKLLAIKPELSVAELAELLKRTADKDAASGIAIVNPLRARQELEKARGQIPR